MTKIVLTHKQWEAIGRKAGWTMYTDPTGDLRAMEEGIREHVDNAFVELATVYGLKHGDFTPEQEGKLSTLVNQIAELAVQWREQNR